MGTITVNVPDRVEQRFRKRVAYHKGKRKGTLGKAMEEAMEQWSEKHAFADALDLLFKGRPLNIQSWRREEIYERN